MFYKNENRIIFDRALLGIFMHAGLSKRLELNFKVISLLAYDATNSWVSHNSKLTKYIKQSFNS